MSPITGVFDQTDDDEQRRAQERREVETQSARLAVIVADAQCDVAIAFPELDDLRAELLGDMLASHRWERAQAVAGGWSCRSVFQSATTLYATLCQAERERGS